MEHQTTAPEAAANPDPFDLAGGSFGRHGIGVLLLRLSRDFTHRARAIIRARGHTRIQPSHHVVFASLGRKGMRLTQLARRANMSKQAMGQIVDDLQELGYVERTPDPSDGRAKLVRFTPTGLAFVCDSAELLEETWRQYAALIGEEQLDRLQSGLGELLAAALGDPPEWV